MQSGHPWACTSLVERAAATKFDRRCSPDVPDCPGWKCVAKPDPVREGAVTVGPICPVAAASAPVAAKPRKLSYKEQREFDELPKKIEALEAEQKELATFLAQPESYAKEADRATKAQTRVAVIDDELLAAMERWEMLGAR